MKRDLASEYRRLRMRLQQLQAQPVKDFFQIDALIDELEKVQLAFKALHGLHGNNPNE